MSKYPKVTPHLVVNGGVDAIKFYEHALDAEVERVMMAEDGKRVMHAELEINDGTVFLCDEFAEFDTTTSAPAKNAATPVAIHLEFKKPKHVDRMVAQAAEHGAEILMPPADMFWGARYARIRDPFGHVWAFGAQLKHKHKKHDEDELDAEPAEAIEPHVEAKPSRKATTKTRTRGA
jgi:PhnB protein